MSEARVRFAMVMTMGIREEGIGTHSLCALSFSAGAFTAFAVPRTVIMITSE